MNLSELSRDEAKYLAKTKGAIIILSSIDLFEINFDRFSNIIEKVQIEFFSFKIFESSPNLVINRLNYFSINFF